MSTRNLRFFLYYFYGMVQKIGLLLFVVTSLLGKRGCLNVGSLGSNRPFRISMEEIIEFNGEKIRHKSYHKLLL